MTQHADGQNPFLILIQQGGQLKDSFGGIKALFGMITPAIAIGAAAVAALGLAFYQAGGQTDAFKQSLIMSGNYIGKTTVQMSAAVKKVPNNAPGRLLGFDSSRQARCCLRRARLRARPDA